jgi:hypothetical protein
MKTQQIIRSIWTNLIKIPITGYLLWMVGAIISFIMWLANGLQGFIGYYILLIGLYILPFTATLALIDLAIIGYKKWGIKRDLHNP